MEINPSLPPRLPPHSDPPTGSEDRSWTQAGDILDRSGLQRDDHVLMRENLACLLTNMSPDFRQNFELYKASPLDLSGRLQDSLHDGMVWTPQRVVDNRMLNKLRRDLTKPYDDQQVLRRLDALDEELSDRLLRFQNDNHGGWPMQVCLVGGLPRGRFGANSDADILMLGGPQAQVADELLIMGKGGVQIHTTTADHWEEDAQRFGPTVPLFPNQTGRLRDAHAHAMEAKGFVMGCPIYPNATYVHRAERMPP